EVEFEPAEQLVDPEACNLGFHRAGIEPRDFEQSREDILDGLKRGVDVGDELRFAPTLAFPASLGGERGGEAFDKACDVQPRSVQGLKDVMARGGQESRL